MFEFARTFVARAATLAQSRQAFDLADHAGRLRRGVARAAWVVAVGLFVFVTLGCGDAAAISAGCTAMNGTSIYGFAPVWDWVQSGR